MKVARYWLPRRFSPRPGLANAQDLAAGEQSFRKCLPCHSVGEDAQATRSGRC